MKKKMEVIGEQSHQLAKVPSITSTEQNSQICFLIEGFSSANDPMRFPEISAAIHLSQANHCEYFDSISSYDTEQIGTLLKGKSEIEHKAILLGIYLDFSSEGSSADIIKNLLINPYQEFFGEVPKWLNNLNPFTINVFAAEVLASDIFNGDPEKFKLYNRSVREEAARISDEISARRFIAYVSERPELKTIYGLIGSAHLNMLDNIGKVITKEDNYKLIKVQLNDNAINVHLYGGRHGEMEHYELLAKRAEQDRLIVPPPPVVTEDKSMEALLRLLLSSGSFSLQPSRHELSDLDEEEKIEQRSINELVNQFDYWMKHYNHNEKLTHNEELVAWLTADSGGKHIKTYEQFCDFALELNKKNYDTMPPPSKSEFDKGMEMYMKKVMPRSIKDEYTGKMFDKRAKPNEEKSINELVNRFDYWMKNYNHNEKLTHNEELVAWLTADSGGKHIKTYEQFCELAEKLNNKGYLTSVPPVESEFNKAMKEYDEKERYSKKFM